MSDSSYYKHGVVVQAFSKTGQTREQWLNHFKQHIEPQLNAIVKAQITVDELKLISEIEGLRARIAQARITTPSSVDLSQCQAIVKSAAFATMERETGIEHIVQPAVLVDLHRTKAGLAVFDMDSTLIQQEVIDELARAVGLYDQVAAITEAAMRGEAPYTDFEASLRARVALLEGVPVSIWEQLKTSTIKFTPGARELTRALRALGWKTAVLSGGFTPLAVWVKETLGLDYAYANHLVADEERGVLTGELVSGQPIIHAEKKRELLQKIAADNNISLSQVIAVGDGSNDLLMMGVAGLGIAFNAKPKVQQAAPVRLNSETLLGVMHILGYDWQEVQGLLEKAMP